MIDMIVLHSVLGEYTRIFKYLLSLLRDFRPQPLESTPIKFIVFPQHEGV